MCAHHRSRVATVLPLLAVCLIGLFGFVSLAVDLGMLAVSRTRCQNAADAAALAGTRTLNNKDGVGNSNLPAAVATAKAVATANHHLGANFTAAQVTSVEAGQYLYDTPSQRFTVTNWTNATGGSAPAPSLGSWTAMRVTIRVAQPTYFMKVFGVTTMPTGARAAAVHRPRDIAFVLDMTGSMAYGSTFNFNNRSMNPDPLVPQFGHYASAQPNLVATSNQLNSTNEAIARNNFSIATPAGPPILRNFYFDPTNLQSPATPGYPLSLKGDGSPNLVPAFHRWNPPESGGDPFNYVAPTYTWAGYDAYSTATGSAARGPTPAPESFGTMTDVSGIPYVGDRWRRADGTINKTEANWNSSAPALRGAVNAAELLGYGSSPPDGFASDWSNFRDPLWEEYGYDLDIGRYRTARGSSGPLSPAAYLASNGGADGIRVPAADRYQGFSMGPGYWGKTFYIWPPDPRAPAGNPGDAGYQAGDWRRRYFLSVNTYVDRRRTTTNGTTFTVTSTTAHSSSAPFDPQGDNNPRNGSGAGATDGINEVLLGTTLQTLATSNSTQIVQRVTTTTNTTTGQVTVTNDTTVNAGTESFRVNYAAVLRWLKSGPQVLPPNLRAGRVVYYTSIPDDVDTSAAGLSDEEKFDRAFWKEYIDFVLGIGRYSASANLYGPADNWATAPASITISDLGQYRFAWEPDGPGSRPYMRYTDSPLRPRLHFWFGPLSMVHFLTRAGGNWLPGTCYESQCWQLKAGMNAVLEDVKNNHPNDIAGLVMFASPQHNGVRAKIGQDFRRLKNALFYPKRLLADIDAGSIAKEFRPYSDLALGGYDDAEIPNAAGITDPNTGLAYAFNLLSPGTSADAANWGAGGGRRGAQKLIIFETDGVPNAYRTVTFNARGYNSYYTVGASSGNFGNGNTTVQSEAYKVVQQITRPMASNPADGTDSGLSLPNAPARVYPIAFGDLFDEQLAPSATYRDTAREFLAQVAAYGGTGPAGATTIPDAQIITGSYRQRIDRLRDCLERIFQSGVSVVLIE